MYKVLILFGRPVDAAGFDDYFEATHRPLLTRLPGLEAVTIDRVAGAAAGDAPHHVIVELLFANEEALRDGLNSEPGQAMARDFGRFASGGVTILFCAAESVSVPGH